MGALSRVPPVPFESAGPFVLMLLKAYRFCGQKVAHTDHLFYRDAGAWAGSTHYTCPGWVPAEMRSDHV